VGSGQLEERGDWFLGKHVLQVRGGSNRLRIASIIGLWDLLCWTFKFLYSSFGTG